MNKHFHFIGIGGAGMSGIARIMLAQGLRISGSDAKETTVTNLLQTLGAKIYLGHAAENQEGADVVVVSTAIAGNNPELVAAIARGVTIMPRAEALALVMAGKQSVAVAGTHGKTTTTSMLTVALQRAGVDPSFAIGGMINSSGTNAHWGSGDFFVAEADESDGSFLAYKPFGAIITNLELDHVDHFPSLEILESAFIDFVGSIQPNGFLVTCLDDPGVDHLLKRVKRDDIKIITYGEVNSDSDYVISRISLQESSSTARVVVRGKVLGEVKLRIPGRHNILNAVASLAAGEALGIPTVDLLQGLSEFSGSRRRFELRGEAAGVKVIDDYGHHPTEVRVTLETARRYTGTGKLIVIFQPHRFTRTQMFASDFADALSLADEIYLLEVYAASEEPIPGVSSLLITKNQDPAKFHYQPSMIQVIDDVVGGVKSGDVVLTLGAGDVSSLGPVLLGALEESLA